MATVTGMPRTAQFQRIMRRSLTVLANEVDMSKLKTSKFDVAEHLRTSEEMAAYLEACIEEAPQDAAFIAKAVGDIARAKGMSQVAIDAGLSRESLYKALSGDRSPDFDTILRVMSALGLRLHATIESLVPSPDKHMQPTRAKHRMKREARATRG